MRLLPCHALAGRIFLREVRKLGNTESAERQSRPQGKAPVPGPRVVPGDGGGILSAAASARAPRGLRQPPPRPRRGAGPRQRRPQQREREQRDRGLGRGGPVSPAGRLRPPAAVPPAPPPACTKAALASRAKTNWPTRSFSSGCTSRAASSHSWRLGRQAAQGKAQRTLPIAPRRRRDPRLAPPPPLPYGTTCACAYPWAGGPRRRGTAANQTSKCLVSDRGMRQVSTYQGKGGACG